MRYNIASFIDRFSCAVLTACRCSGDESYMNFVYVVGVPALIYVHVSRCVCRLSVVLLDR
jgi:hypothetical protein